MDSFKGAMTFGYEGTDGARLHTPEAVSEVLDIFQKHGFTEVRRLSKPRVCITVDAYTMIGRLCTHLYERLI